LDELGSKMNLSFVQPAVPTVNWHVLLESLESGQVAAWVAELPECMVTANSQDAAITALEHLLSQRLASVKVLSLKLSADDDGWLKLGGILKDDESFREWSDNFWAEKQGNIEEGDFLSVEESLRVM
jgi:hypothetical protein